MKMLYLMLMNQNDSGRTFGGKEVKHNGKAEWLNNFKQEMGDTPKQQRVEITEPKVEKLLRKVPN